MTTPINDHQTAVELAQLRTELHATNRNMERIAISVEKTIGDHESRIRAVEISTASNQDVRRDVDALKAYVNKGLGLLIGIQFLGLAGLGILFSHYVK